MKPTGKTALEFHVSVFNRPEIIPGFFTEALRVAESLGCQLDVPEAPGNPSGGRRQGLWPIPTGNVADLEIRILGARSEEAFESLRSLMAQRFCEVRHLVN